MVRSYLRHEPTSAFGVICSSDARSLLSSDAKVALVPALEDVLVWDVKRGAQLSLWHEIGHRAKVTAIARAPPSPGSVSDEELYAVGYDDGSIRIWDANTSAVKLTFNGHKKAVTTLAFDSDGLRLASGSLDTDIILWDVVGESGLFRLRGHRNAITDLTFLSASNAQASSSSSAASASAGYVLSVSKDGLLKLWDLSLQHCIETVVPGKGELWSLAVSENIQMDLSLASADDKGYLGTLVVTGSSEGEVRLWEIPSSALAAGLQSQAEAESSAEEGAKASRFIRPHGVMPLAPPAGKRVTQMAFSASRRQDSSFPDFLAVMSSDKAVQIFRLRTTEDIRKKMARRRKRLKEKAEKKGGAAAAATDDAANGTDSVTWLDKLEPYTLVRPAASGRIRSFAFAPEPEEKEGSAMVEVQRSGTSLLLALASNALEVHNLPPPPKSKADKAAPIEASLSCGLDLPGHRSEVRALALSSDDTLLASADSSGLLKIWNVSSGRCLRTMPCGYALCATWLPDDKHVLVGCKDGSLRFYDVHAGEMLESIEAHEGPLWTIALRPDGLGIVSGSADKDVKFWEFEMRSVSLNDEEGSDGGDGAGDDEDDEAPARPQRQQLSLLHVKTLRMTDDVLCARFSPDGRLLALSLLDSTVKVFYADSLKFFLSLYGHKLPVLSMDISPDSKLCVTVSADKNAKIWGLDYGDCHKSLFAHDEGIMAVAFEQGEQGGGLMGGREGASHHFWTVGRDAKVKHWDGDRFELIQTLEGHHGEVWALAVGKKGTLAVTAGADRSIRTWEKTDEPLFLEEEREKELERLYETAAPGGADGREDGGAIGSLTESGAVNQGEEAESGLVTKSTNETLMAGERLMEALDIARADVQAQAQHEREGKLGAPPARNPVLAASFGPGEDVDAYRYVLRTTEKIPAAQLEDALLVLPFDKVISLMESLDHWARKEWSIPLVARILFFLLRTHHNQIVANRVMRTTLASLRGHLRAALRRQKTTMGFNLAALRYVRSQHVAQKTSDLYERQGLDMSDEAVKERLEANSRRKRKLVITS